MWVSRNEHSLQDVVWLVLSPSFELGILFVLLSSNTTFAF